MEKLKSSRRQMTTQPRRRSRCLPLILVFVLCACSLVIPAFGENGHNSPRYRLVGVRQLNILDYDDMFSSMTRGGKKSKKKKSKSKDEYEYEEEETEDEYEEKETEDEYEEEETEDEEEETEDEEEETEGDTEEEREEKEEIFDDCDETPLPQELLVSPIAASDEGDVDDINDEALISGKLPPSAGVEDDGAADKPAREPTQDGEEGGEGKASASAPGRKDDFLPTKQSTISAAASSPFRTISVLSVGAICGLTFL